MRGQIRLLLSVEQRAWLVGCMLSGRGLIKPRPRSHHVVKYEGFPSSSVVSNPAATTLRERKQKYRMPKKKRGVEQRVKGNVKVCCEQVVKHDICLHAYMYLYELCLSI